MAYDNGYVLRHPYWIYSQKGKVILAAPSVT